MIKPEQLIANPDVLGMSERHMVMYMAQAYTLANSSYAKDLKVGALLVQPLANRRHRIIAEGINGTEVGEDNCCEHPDGESRDDVIHAERNLLRKVLRSNESSVGCSLFVTRSPCSACSELIIDAGIKNVIVCEVHHDPAPLHRLYEAGVRLHLMHKNTLINYFDEVSRRLRQPKFNEAS